MVARVALTRQTTPATHASRRASSPTRSAQEQRQQEARAGDMGSIGDMGEASGEAWGEQIGAEYSHYLVGDTATCRTLAYFAPPGAAPEHDNGESACAGCIEHPSPDCAACGAPATVALPSGVWDEHAMSLCPRCYALVLDIRASASSERERLAPITTIRLARRQEARQRQQEQRQQAQESKAQRESEGEQTRKTRKPRQQAQQSQERARRTKNTTSRPDVRDVAPAGPGTRQQGARKDAQQARQLQEAHSSDSATRSHAPDAPAGPGGRTEAPAGAKAHRRRQQAQEGVQTGAQAHQAPLFDDLRAQEGGAA